jgi:ABC-2 type transport system ATP-binding protein
VHDVLIEGSRIRCSVDQDRLDELLRWLLDREVTDLITRPPTLEDLFLDEYGRNGES